MVTIINILELAFLNEQIIFKITANKKAKRCGSIKASNIPKPEWSSVLFSENIKKYDKSAI